MANFQNNLWIPPPPPLGFDTSRFDFSKFLKPSGQSPKNEVRDDVPSVCPSALITDLVNQISGMNLGGIPSSQPPPELSPKPKMTPPTLPKPQITQKMVINEGLTPPMQLNPLAAMAAPSVQVSSASFFVDPNILLQPAPQPAPSGQPTQSAPPSTQHNFVDFSKLNLESFPPPPTIAESIAPTISLKSFKINHSNSWNKLEKQPSVPPAVTATYQDLRYPSNTINPSPAPQVSSGQTIQPPSTPSARSSLPTDLRKALNSMSEDARSDDLLAKRSSMMAQISSRNFKLKRTQHEIKPNNNVNKENSHTNKPKSPNLKPPTFEEIMMNAINSRRAAFEDPESDTEQPTASMDSALRQSASDEDWNN